MRGEQNEDRRRWRLLERFQQRVLRRIHQRIGLVDDHDAPLAFERTIHRAIDDVADLLDLDRSVLARLDDQDIRVDASRDADAGGACAARIDC
jgi:transcriptional regulator with GAF, ATPase, and Fis domain